jgi:Lipopolysaccharide-assembly
MNRRRFLGLALGGLGVAVAGCQPGGHFGLFGYTTAPPFDNNIRSVCIPIFKLAPVVTSPLRNLDVELTDAVVKELNARKSPIRVVSNPTQADTILIGTIAGVNKGLQSYNQQALPLENELILTVDLVWRDQRTGEVLSNPKAKKPESGVGAFDPSAVKSEVVEKDVAAAAVRVTASGRFLIQNGESMSVGADTAVRKMAANIVNMMEAPWQLPAPAGP